MGAGFGNTDAPIRSVASDMISKIRGRSYSDFDGFRQDLNSYLTAVDERDGKLDGGDRMRLAWVEALNWLREDHWHKYLFDADAELAIFDL